MVQTRSWAVFCLLLLVSLTACQGDYNKLKAENDSLRNELHHGGKVVNAVVSVNTLLDSIDATRHVLRAHHSNGDEAQSYGDRMQELKAYVKQTEEKIGELEAHMVEKNVSSESYLAIINALKDELSMRNEEMGLIEANAELNNEQMLKGVQLEDVEARFEVKKIELMLLELRINEMIKRMGMSEAEGLYLQAEALEEAARRTKLAPFKRKQTYREALGLYEGALAKGKKEAQAKIDLLRNKVGADDN